MLCEEKMIVLVPKDYIDELLPFVQSISPEISLRPYVENEALPDMDQVSAIYRGPAGKWFSQLAADSPNLRWLHTASAGVDHVLTPQVRAKAGVVVTNSGPAFEIAISEFILAWILMVARGLPQLIENQHARVWKSVDQTEVFGATVGIVGLGPIGKGTAARAKAFGMRTIGFRRHNAPVENIDVIFTDQAGLDQLLRQSDYVVLAAALTDNTRQIIGKRELEIMKKTAWLINIARGPIIDETALISALKQGKLAGACLDVFETEPLPESSELWVLPNVYIAPHNSAGWSAGLRARQRDIFLENLKLFCHGEPLHNVVNIVDGY